MTADTIGDAESVMDDEGSGPESEADGTEDADQSLSAADGADADKDADDEQVEGNDVDDNEVDGKDVANKARPDWLGKLRLPASRPSLWVSVIVVAAAIAGGVFGFVKYRSVTNELAALRQAESDRQTAAKVAKDYALKSLTYSFEDPDAFFRSVEAGVSPTLKDKYVNATDLLKGIMVQAQVTSTGEVLATDAVAQPGRVYQVVVSAAQTTRNLQNPKPRMSLILLQVTVNKVGDSWQVSDIGPKSAGHPANADPLAPPEAGPEPRPVPAPGR